MGAGLGVSQELPAMVIKPPFTWLRNKNLDLNLRGRILTALCPPASIVFLPSVRPRADSYAQRLEKEQVKYSSLNEKRQKL